MCFAISGLTPSYWLLNTLRLTNKIHALAGEKAARLRELILETYGAP